MKRAVISAAALAGATFVDTPASAKAQTPVEAANGQQLNGEIRQALDQGPWSKLEIRHLRKAVRFRLANRKTRPSGHNTTQGISLARRRQLDAIAEWIVQEAK